MYYKEIVSEYKHISEEIGIDKSLIPIEITESAAITNNEIKEIAEKFYQAGFVLHMDDFGSGYSSLATLNILHFDTLKLDKSLIDYIGNFGGERLIEHTVLLAKELGMHITAEGVEVENQVNFLKQIGCDSIQGYFYSKPIPTEKFELLLSTTSIRPEPNSRDLISLHVNNFKQSVLKQPLYNCIVNISKNEITEFTENTRNKVMQTLVQKDFSATIEGVAKHFIAADCREKFLTFLNPEMILKDYNSDKGPEFKVLYIDGYVEDVLHHLVIIANIFKVDGIDDIYGYFMVKAL